MPTHTIRKLGCIMLSLMAVLFLIRPQVLDIAYFVVFRYPRAFYMVLLASYYDLLLVAGLGAAFMALAYLFRSFARVQRWLLGAFLGLALVCVAVGLSYVTTSTLLGGPLTYGWLYYSDFMQNSDFYTALQANLSWQWAGQLLGWCAGLLLGSYLLWAGLRRLDPQGQKLRGVVTLLALGLVVYFAVAPRRIAANNLTYKLTANPVLAFSNSVYAALATPPDLFTLQIPAKFEAFPTPAMAGGTTGHAPSNPRIRNVLLFVLESVPAEYVPGYQPRTDVMPELARQLPHALRVADMYAHIPSTNNAVVALLASLYPKISYQSISKEHPDIRRPSISSELKKKGFRTGFFFAADTRFQNMNGFLANRQLDTIADFQTIPCSQPAQEIDPEKTDFLSSSDEACLIQSVAKWLPKDSAAAPFFATVWTAQTHYPYFPAGAEHNYGVSERYLNRYLNALHYSDQQLGQLLRELRRRGLAESTLVVVVGDHGEAFGRHVQYGHASNIYEENVRIPLLLLNPVLFHGETLPVIGGQVDVAPTLFDVLRLPIPAEWQGTSLFNPERVNRAYFFSPYSQYTFGYRDARHKVILNAAAGTTQVYDLQHDSHETTNIADRMPDYVLASRRRLARWVQYQDAYLQQALAPPAKPAPGR
ncbi:hypothetical protein GCM10022409_38160 [Hymenobacter glaciei]|uniref:Sulfatase N-terminal domain-containing protein n=1 Tax=Hymenobacter glaciei TaxID=877209 RepID=A0ABP7UN57_9BACT